MNETTSIPENGNTVPLVESRDPSNLVLAHGVPLFEKPYVERYMPLGNSYDGQRFTVNFPYYLLVGSNSATQRGTNLNVMPFGGNHAVDKLSSDPDKLKQILEGGGTPVESNFLDYVIAIEKIRNTFVEACAKVMELQNVYTSPGSLTSLREDTSYRDRFLQKLAWLKDQLYETIPFYGGYSTLKDALDFCLPKSKRENPDQNLRESAKNYLLGELVTINLILDNNESYITYEGQDVPKQLRKKGIKDTITKCLREIGINIFSVMPGGGIDTALRERFGNRWVVSHLLDGSSYDDKGHHRVTPYYASQSITAIRPSAMPWKHGGITRMLTAGKGGREAAGRVIIPVLHRHLHQLVMTETGKAALAKSLGHMDHAPIMTWAENDTSSSSGELSLQLASDVLNDMFRGICERIAVQVFKALGEDSQFSVNHDPEEGPISVHSSHFCGGGKGISQKDYSDLRTILGTRQDS